MKHSKKVLTWALTILLCLMSCVIVCCKKNTMSTEVSQQVFFLPAQEGKVQPFVGDVMPYYEDGTYYFYYLKDGGSSFRHSIYLATTKDFINYTEYKDPILETLGEGQEEWIGTGSVVKIKGIYYFFYTAHADSSDVEYKEKIYLAKGKTLFNFERVKNFEIVADDSIGQKRDFRDPQSYYDPTTGRINITITASKDGRAVILKYSLNDNLSDITYDGVIFEDPVSRFWNLECSDTFNIGDYWYLIYSAQDDTLWYAKSASQYGPFSDAKPLDGKLYYAAKHVTGKDGCYLAGWIRRSSSENSLSVTSWGGDLCVQKLIQGKDGELYLKLPDQIEDFICGKNCVVASGNTKLESLGKKDYKYLFTSSDTYLIKGKFIYKGNGCFGLGFSTDGDDNGDKFIVVDTKNQTLNLTFNQQDILITQKDISIESGKEYNFTYIQQKSSGIFYIEDNASITVRLYKTSDKSVSLFAEDTDIEFSYTVSKL